MSTSHGEDPVLPDRPRGERSKEPVLILPKEPAPVGAHRDAPAAPSTPRRGPKTANGRAAVRHNALKHGITSTCPVIPGMESEAEWHHHCPPAERQSASTVPNITAHPPRPPRRQWVPALTPDP